MESNREVDLQFSIPSTVALIAILFGVVGGLNSFIYVLGLNQIRVWSRVTPLIAFCALAVGASICQIVLEKFSKSGLRSTAALLALISIFGIWDQSSATYVPLYKENKRIWNIEEDFTRKADAIFPEDSMIFQMPVVDFPENGPLLKMEDYAQAFPAIHQSKLRWSYGNIKTRPSTFHMTAKNLNNEDLVDYLLGQKFAGIHIVRRGLQDGGTAFERLCLQLGGKVVLRSTNGEDVLIDIRPIEPR
jgi:phosphoglycerol transferase